MRVLSFSGTPKQLGEAFGESCRADIQAFYQLRVENALSQAKEFGGRIVGEAKLLAVAEASLRKTEAFDPDGLEEMAGIARAAHLSLAQVFALNGLTDLRDVLAWWDGLDDLGGCSAFVVSRDASRSGELLLGQTWDLASDNMPFVLGVHRRPKNAPETWTLTTAGCLSLIGINGEGVAVGTTNVRTEDARPGVCYLSVLHQMLARRTLLEAHRDVERAHRAGGHFYYAADKSGRAFAAECSATRMDTTWIERGRLVHTNHCLAACNVELEADTPHASSHARQARLEGLLDQAIARGGVSLGDVKAAISDHENGDDAICRHGAAGISSNGAILLSPDRPLAEAGHGPPCKTTWIDLFTHRA